MEDFLVLIAVQLIAYPASFNALPVSRCFSTTSPTLNWLTPKFMEKSKSPKGRPHVATGGSSRGTTVVMGDYGLRMKDHDRRIASSAFKLAYETIKRRLRGMKYQIFTRVSANIGVYTKGNEQRMGKGKGKFDYWATRLPVNRVVFELKGDIHEQVAREAFRLAGHKLPGMFSHWGIEVVGANLAYNRSLGIREKGRPPCCWSDKTREWCHFGESQTTTQKPAPRHEYSRLTTKVDHLQPFFLSISPTILGHLAFMPTPLEFYDSLNV